MFAHDIKTPVITVSGFLSRLLSGKAGLLTEPQLNYLHIMKDELTKVEDLISDFLEFSRFEATEYRPLESVFNIEEALSLKNVQILDCDVEEPNAHLLLNSICLQP